MGESYQQHFVTYISHEEGDYTPEYGIHGNVFCHSFNNKYIQAKGWGNQCHLTHSYDNDSKPNRVKTKLRGERVKYGGDKENHCGRIKFMQKRVSEVIRTLLFCRRSIDVP